MGDLGSGDRLARGAVKAAFMPSTTTTDDKWSKAFDDFDPEEFKKDKTKVEGGKKEKSKR
jgi:hypothetical protein